MRVMNPTCWMCQSKDKRARVMSSRSADRQKEMGKNSNRGILMTALVLPPLHQSLHYLLKLFLGWGEGLGWRGLAGVVPVRGFTAVGMMSTGFSWGWSGATAVQTDWIQPWAIPGMKSHSSKGWVVGFMSRGNWNLKGHGKYLISAMFSIGWAAERN